MTNSHHLGQTDRGEKNGKDMTTAQIKNRMHRPKREGRTKTNTYMDNNEGKGRFVRIVEVTKLSLFKKSASEAYVRNAISSPNPDMLSCRWLPILKIQT